MVLNHAADPSSHVVTTHCSAFCQDNSAERLANVIGNIEDRAVHLQTQPCSIPPLARDIYLSDYLVEPTRKDSLLNGETDVGTAVPSEVGCISLQRGATLLMPCLVIALWYFSN